MSAYTQPAGAVTTDIVFGAGTYYVERYDGASPANRWRLVYPDGTHQRTRNKRDAMRLARLHAIDLPEWTREVKGDGAAVSA